MSSASTPAARPRRSLLPTRRPPGTESAGTPQVPRVPPGRGRPHRLILVVIAVVAVIVAVAAWLVVGGRGTPAATSTTLLISSPTPTLSPVPRPEEPFAQSLPSTVLQYALVSSVDYPDWRAAGALDAYQDEFSDGRSGTLVLRVGQWASAPEAAAAFAAFTDGAAPLEGGSLAPTGRVFASDVEVGTYLVADAGDGNATVTWSNSTAVLQLTGPVAEVERAYRAFPL
jgi:hypothetical protein